MPNDLHIWRKEPKFFSIPLQTAIIAFSISRTDEKRESMVRFRIGKRVLLAFGIALMGGCAWYDQTVAKNPLFDPNRVSRQEEAGSCHVAVLSVARWETYPAVQPQFSLTSDQALAAAIPDTSILENKLLSSTAAQFSAQVGSGAGTAPTVSAVVPGNGLADLPGTGATLSQLGQDPILRYWAATALYEEVQILNRYLKDAAISDQYYPYLIRAQVTVMPKRRNLPYDAYSAMSFFVDDFADYPPAKRLVREDKLLQAVADVANEYTKKQTKRFEVQENSKSIPRPFLGSPSTTRPAVSSTPPATTFVTPSSDQEAAREPIVQPSTPDGNTTTASDSKAKLKDRGDFDSLACRTALVQKLQIFTSDEVTEALSKEAVVDGMKIASAHEDAGLGDTIQSALAYARDRSPRFAGFRGQDLSEYFDAGKLAGIITTPPDDDAQKIQKAINDYHASINKYGETRVDRNWRFTLVPECLEQPGTTLTIPNLNPFEWRAPCAMIDPLSDWKGKAAGHFSVNSSKLVSIDDLIISLNEATSLFKTEQDVEEWKDAVDRLISLQAGNGTNFRPYVASPRPQMPVVIPLVVTDDLQSAIESRSAEQIRQIALSLAAAAGKANVAGGLTNLDEQLRNTLGRSLDSTFTIAREADNTIRARFGASLQAGSRFAMVPEAHNVTLLVLVPKVYIDTVRKPYIHMKTTTDFVDAETGRTLPEKHGPEKNAFVTKILEEENLRLHAGIPADLLYDAANNNMDDFKARLGGDSGSCERAWNRVLTWYNTAPDGFASIPLEKPATPDIPLSPDGLVAALDDGKKNLTVTVLGHGNLFQQSISAELWAVAPSPGITHSIKLQSTKTNVDLSVDNAGKLSLTTANPSTVTVDPGKDGITIAQQKNGTIDFPKTQPAKVQLGTDGDLTITTDPQGKFHIADKGNDALTASNAGSGAPTDDGKTVVVWSTATTIGDDKRTITFTFPSLAAMDLASSTKKPQLFMKVHFFRADNDEIPALPADNLVPLDYRSQKPKTLAIKLAAQAKVINSKTDGTGDLLVTISGFDPTTITSPIFLTVDGAGLTSATTTGTATPTSLTIAADKTHAGMVAITANGVIKLSFEGLNPIANVTISAQDDTGAKVETPITEIVEHATHAPANVIETNLTSVKQSK